MLNTARIKQFLQLLFQCFQLFAIKWVQFFLRRVKSCIFQINIMIKIRIRSILRELRLFKHFWVRLLQLLQNRISQLNITMLITLTMSAMCSTMRKITLLFIILLLQRTQKYFFILSLLNATNKWFQIAHLKQVLACTQINLVTASTRYIIQHFCRTLSISAFTLAVFPSILLHTWVSGLPDFFQRSSINFTATKLLASYLTHGHGTNNRMVLARVGGDCRQCVGLAERITTAVCPTVQKNTKAIARHMGQLVPFELYR